MKFKAKQLKNGNWAVFAGTNKFFPHTETESEWEAKLAACEESAVWHQQQQDACQREWDRLRAEANVDDDRNWGDVLA